ncbi:IS1595 family transposase [Qipengyuania sp. DY56-A-20]|jgi:transposase-like protein|uniref:IS1595 family transposase n=1 Tax=Qipengyuania benthica TaxID=3067651 RepID=A0ABT9H5U4_9SPHN|nr:IS1595 family transposase [Qipengyuania sp. DY56-A-20]MDP4538225.1 IS1595 family transposase [Qipengyuania sp. DY56-A-20]
MTNIYAPRFQNEDAAREHLEALHWPHGPVCPHCESGDTKRLPPQRGRKTKAHPEGALRKGVVQCNLCRKQFTVTVGTVFESSKVPLHKWLRANHLIVSSKKGISAHQLHRTLGVTYKTAWFMAHRIREAMTPTDNGPMGGDGGDVEVDETYYGKNKSAPKSRMAIRNMNRIVSLVERNTGRATSIVFNGAFGQNDVKAFLFERLDRNARLLTDEAHVYKPVGQHYRAHGSVNHFKGEYVSRADPTNHTNTIEGFFGIFKRGMRGIYQHCGQQHLARYLAEFDFRYTNRSGLGINDTERADIALKGIAGKRLTYRRIGGLAAA